jgi:phosphopantothenoylcysteine decarboxylase
MVSRIAIPFTLPVLIYPVTFHSRHHRLYVPYAYGALYNHPLEGFAMDTLGAGLAYLLTGMTMRQSMWFFTGSTIKTVLDHGGYDFPWDPVHWIFPNNAAYHDIHHQSWGIKTNFSQPFFVYLDRVGGTMYKGDIKEKYERARKTAQQKLDQERENEAKAAPAAEPASLPPLEQENTVPTQSISTPHIPRKKATSMSSPAVNFKVSTNKSNSNLSGRGAKLLGQKPVQHQSRETLRSDPFTFDHRDDKIHVLLCASGSVATIKIPNMINALARHGNVRIRLIFTTAAANFLQGQSAEQPSIADIEAWPNVDGVYFDADEWAEPWVRGNKILHIELRRWADIMVIAPFSANELAKLTQGRSDNLLLSVARAWDTTGLIDPVRDIPGVRWPEEQTGARRKKRILVAPSMNTAMWFQPITKQQVHVLEEEWGAKNGGWVEVLQPMEKELACGDIGGGAMKDWRDIVSIIEERLSLSSNSAA